MSKIKLLLDVVEDMRSLADSLQSLAEAMTQGNAPEAGTESLSTPSQGAGGHAGAGSVGAG